MTKRMRTAPGDLPPGAVLLRLGRTAVPAPRQAGCSTRRAPSPRPPPPLRGRRGRTPVHDAALSARAVFPTDLRAPYGTRPCRTRRRRPTSRFPCREFIRRGTEPRPPAPHPSTRSAVSPSPTQFVGEGRGGGAPRPRDLRHKPNSRNHRIPQSPNPIPPIRRSPAPSAGASAPSTVRYPAGHPVSYGPATVRSPLRRAARTSSRRTDVFASSVPGAPCERSSG
jgi:hypothetical protein